MATATLTKDPDSVLDFSFDYTLWLNGDDISTSTWTVPSGLTEPNASTSDTKNATVWLGSGTEGSSYVLLNRIVTAGGRTEDFSYTVYVIESATGLPPSAVVLLDEFKQHARIVGTQHDAVLQAYLDTAEKYVAEVARVRPTNTTETLELPCFPLNRAARLYMPWGPLSSVTSITYTDAAGSSQTVATSVYGVNTTTQPGFIHLKYNQFWPTSLRQDVALPDVVVITYVAGYGATGADVPATMRQAIKLLALHLFENREATTPDGVNLKVLPIGLQAMLSSDSLKGVR